MYVIYTIRINLLKKKKYYTANQNQKKENPAYKNREELTSIN